MTKTKQAGNRKVSACLCHSLLDGVGWKVTGREARRFLKEGFHLSGGLEGYKDLSWIFANVRPDVWHLSWGKDPR